MDGALAGGIIEQPGAAAQAGDGTRVDDAGARPQMRQRGAGHVEITMDVGAQGLVPFLVADGLQPVVMVLERGVVDQHVEPAEGLRRLRHGLVAESRFAHVAGDQQAAAAFGLDRAPGFARVVVFVQIDDGDVGAFAREQHAHRAADAGIAAGDDGGHAGQFAAALVVGRQVLRGQGHFAFPAGLGQVLPGHGGDGMRPAAGIAGCGHADLPE